LAGASRTNVALSSPDRHLDKNRNRILQGRCADGLGLHPSARAG
jgi:hypothetical protein